MAGLWRWAGGRRPFEARERRWGMSELGERGEEACGCAVHGDLAAGALLLIGHPGHELRLHGWLAHARPTVAVLTDGSGRSGRSRLDATAETLDQAGARRAAGIFGGLSDVDLYQLLLARDAARAFDLAQGIATALVEGAAPALICDAAEGFNPGHDFCRGLGGFAVRLAAARGWRGAFYELPLEGPPVRPGTAPALALDLCADCFAAKRSRSRDCPDLLPDVDVAERESGLEAFRREAFYETQVTRAPAAGADGLGAAEAVPYYELWGQLRVGEGKYANVVRRAGHVLPLFADLETYLRRELAVSGGGR